MWYHQGTIPPSRHRGRDAVSAARALSHCPLTHLARSQSPPRSPLCAGATGSVAESCRSPPRILGQRRRRLPHLLEPTTRPRKPRRASQLAPRRSADAARGQALPLPRPPTAPRRARLRLRPQSASTVGGPNRPLGRLPPPRPHLRPREWQCGSSVSHARAPRPLYRSAWMPPHASSSCCVRRLRRLHRSRRRREQSRRRL